jgi:pimeloyl-ACP methyl ester carboxylesterase
MSAVRKGYVDTGWGQVHVRRSGAHGQAVFLLHQSPLSSRQFELLLPQLAVSFRACAFDTPGYGNSDPPEHALSAAEYGRRLLAAIDQITAGPFALLGVLTGSVVALEINRLASARVSHLVLVDTPLDIPVRPAKTEYRADAAHILDLWRHRMENWGPGASPELAHHATVDVMLAYER